MRFYAAIVCAAVLAAGCSKSESAEPPPVEREKLAAMGYYGMEEAKAVWKERRAVGITLDDGSELVGRSLDSWYLTEWVGSEPMSLRDLRGRVVVVRFWTSPGCPFCEKTMPALQALADELAGDPVTFIGAFHAKPPKTVADMKEPSAVAKDWRVKFPIAFDREWKTLGQWWLAEGVRRATSVTFVIGKDGKILHIHPGPVFHPSDDPAEAKQNSDYIAVREAIRSGLK